MTITQFKDVAAAYRGETTLDASSDEAWVELKIRQAERLLEGKVGNLGQYDPQLVTDTVAEAVARVVGNPDRLVAESDADYSYRRAEGSRAGTLYFTQDELAAFGTSSTGVARTIITPVTGGYRGWS